MKKICLLMIFFFSFLIVGCNKDQSMDLFVTRMHVSTLTSNEVVLKLLTTKKITSFEVENDITTKLSNVLKKTSHESNQYYTYDLTIKSEKPVKLEHLDCHINNQNFKLVIGNIVFHDEQDLSTNYVVTSIVSVNQKIELNWAANLDNTQIEVYIRNKTFYPTTIKNVYLLDKNKEVKLNSTINYDPIISAYSEEKYGNIYSNVVNKNMDVIVVVEYKWLEIDYASYFLISNSLCAWTKSLI